MESGVKDQGDTGLHVLLAEDNELNRKVMIAFLEHLGHRVAVVVDGNDAFAAITSTQDFDVVLVDIQLPGMSGIDVVAALRGTAELLPHLVAVTAMARSDGEQFYRQQGFDAYIGKPVQLKELELVLQAVSRRSTR